MSQVIRLTDLTNAIGGKIKTLRVMITGSAAGDLTGLTTTNKTSVVAAINEVKADAAGASTPFATNAEALAGVATDLATTPANVAAVRADLKAEILGGAGPAFDTLNELKGLLDASDTADDSAIASLVTADGNRLRIDTNAQGLTAPQKQNGRDNLDVYSRAELGDPETDLVAIFNAALA